MRLSLLIAVIALISSCSTADTAAHELSPSGYTTAPSAPPAHDGGQPAVDRRQVSGSDLLGADLDTLPDVSKMLVEVEPTADADADVERSHEPLEHFDGPSPLPPLPARFDDPLTLFIWIGHATLNYGPEQPFPDPQLQAFLDSALLPRTLEPEAGKSTNTTSRAVLLEASLNDESSTTTLVTGVAVFERTLGTDTLAEPRIEIVSIDLTSHRVTDGWQIIELQVSSQ